MAEVSEVSRVSKSRPGIPPREDRNYRSRRNLLNLAACGEASSIFFGSIKARACHQISQMSAAAK